MKPVLVGIFLFLSALPPAIASIISDFSWAPTTSTTTSSTILGDGTQVTLSSSNVPYNYDSTNAAGPLLHFQDDTGDDPILTFTFSRNINYLRLNIIDLDRGRESFTNFSILPSFVTEDLALVSNSVESTAGDGTGDIIFTNINASILSFTHLRQFGFGIGFSEMEIDEGNTTIPISGLPLMFIGLVGWLLRPQNNSRIST